MPAWWYDLWSRKRLPDWPHMPAWHWWITWRQPIKLSVKKKTSITIDQVGVVLKSDAGQDTFKAGRGNSKFSLCLFLCMWWCLFLIGDILENIGRQISIFYNPARFCSPLVITRLLDYISDPTGLADFNIQGDSGGFSRASAPLKPASVPRVPIIALCDVQLSKCAFITPGLETGDGGGWGEVPPSPSFPPGYL